MRALELDKETCVVNCDRNGQSGCSPEVTYNYVDLSSIMTFKKEL